MPSQAKRPYSASLPIAGRLLALAVRMGFRRWQVSLMALLVFMTVVGLVYLAEVLYSPHGVSLLAGQILLMASGYVALMTALIVMVYRESRTFGADPHACQQRLRERWPGIRSEMIKTLILGTGMVGLVKFGLHATASQDTGFTLQNAPLIYYPVMGAALFAWVGHFHSCVHMPQLQLVARSTMCSWERAAMAKLATQRYDNPVSLLLFVPIVSALGVAYLAPKATPLLWLLTLWYLEVSFYRLWLFKPSSRTV